MRNLTETLGRLNTTRAQIGWMRFVLFLLSKACNRLLDPHAISSYSQFGEDRIIEAFFGSQAKGVYIDIGCNDPVSYSNTYKLYLKGWNGICVDPNPELIRKHKAIRPRDIAIQKVVSNKSGTVDFYFSKVSHLISGVGEKASGHWKRTADNSDVVRCESVTLSSILIEHNIANEFELLTIDVEGHELEVLNSIDLTVYKPSLIIVEMHDFNLADPGGDPVYNMLISNKYCLQSYVSPNGFFTRTH